MSSSTAKTEEITSLLIEWSDGEPAALEKLMPLVYGELRAIARARLKRELPGQTLQTTDLVHEAYLKLVNQNRVRWQNRGHFYAIASQAMRRILVDRARARNRNKRGAGARHESLSGAQDATAAQSLFDFVVFDEALNRLADIDRRKAQIVELRFFGGLSVEETAEFLKVSPITVARDWKMAKAWLHKQIGAEPSMQQYIQTQR